MYFFPREMPETASGREMSVERRRQQASHCSLKPDFNSIVRPNSIAFITSVSFLSLRSKYHSFPFELQEKTSFNAEEQRVSTSGINRNEG